MSFVTHSFMRRANQLRGRRLPRCLCLHPESSRRRGLDGWAGPASPPPRAGARAHSGWTHRGSRGLKTLVFLRCL